MNTILKSVIAGLDPAIHCAACTMDTRLKAGHDIE